MLSISKVRILLRVALCAVAVSSASQQTVVGVYHEATCPSVKSHMTRYKRVEAEARGFVPAADCHPARFRDLGEIGASAITGAAPDVNPRTVHVRGYQRADGTNVAPHTRAAPRSRR